MQRPFLFALCLFMHAGAPAAAQALPAGGGLDANRVTELRYGAAADPAPVAASATSAATAKPDAASPAAATPSKAKAAPSAARSPAAARTERAAIPDAIATLWLERTDETGNGGQVPVTFGQAFEPGALARGDRLEAKLGDGKRLPLQLDVKALHPDGSVRHAVVSAVLPTPTAQPLAFGLVRSTQDAGSAPADATPAALLKSGLSATVELDINGKRYTASLERLLAQGKPATWLDGPIAREWLVPAPFVDRGGRAHPHLAARFAVRWYPALKKARVDVTVENNWSHEPSPQHITYDARIAVGGDTVYRKEGLTHYHHARWRTLAWWGGDPALHLRHDSRQLMATRALPNYDSSVVVNERALAALYARWEGPRIEPMGVGVALKGMPTAGGRMDIGLHPGWAVMYLLGMDPRARTVTMGTADLAGSWSVHYRDRRTGLPMSLLDYPYTTLIAPAGDTRNPATGKLEALPKCEPAAQCRTPNWHDVAHQPNLVYLPYLLSGDHYYLEELQFWAMHNVFHSNPGYRQYAKGLVKPEQVRGQAWALRNLAEAAYITPDAHPLKAHFLRILDSNLDWYNAEYTDNPAATRLGFLTHGYAIVYHKKIGLAPWQDDFFTSAVGRTAELGFAKAERLLQWKARFVVERMVGAGSCWITASMYAMRVRDTPTSPLYPTIARIFQASHEPQVANLACGSGEFSTALKLKPGQMVGSFTGTVGAPVNMQPALAYAADALGADGQKAWQQFMGRINKADYGTGPQFAIVPRKQ
ncbi:hypothetical protein [Telluria beijingensis]|uniref:RIFT barrel domain-containing protein n=1 Tax=Telluria beijingensis TaxID=3068633 RepID=UPI0027961B6F|nr:hypothetical protein [Massilia sp. REN29]